MTALEIRPIEADDQSTTIDVPVDEPTITPPPITCQE